MSFIPRITCRRCGRQFSGVRSRCPYCGTRRVKASDRSPAPTPGVNPETPAAARAALNTRWQLIFGAILLVAVLLAVIVLVSTSLNNSAAKNTPTPPPSFSIPPATVPPTPSPSPTPVVTELTITCWGEACTDFTTSVGNTTQLKEVIFPTNIENPEVKWNTSDEAVATVDADGLVTAVGPGYCTITCECYGITANAICRVRG